MIHFSINKNLFLQALNTTKRAISHKNAIPILSTVKIDVTKEGITLIGSNGQVSIENFISTQNENAGLLVNSTGSILLEATLLMLFPACQILFWILKKLNKNKSS